MKGVPVAVDIPTDPIEERRPSCARRLPRHYRLATPSSGTDVALPAPEPTPDLGNPFLATPSSDHAALETFNFDDIKLTHYYFRNIYVLFVLIVKKKPE